MRERIPGFSESNCFLSGGHILLRTARNEDFTLFQRWLNDPEIRKLTVTSVPFSQPDMRAFSAEDRETARALLFSVVVKCSGQLIGLARLDRTPPLWREAGLFLLLGEKSSWRRGYGRETAVALMDYAFGELGVHRITAQVPGVNENAAGFFEKIGFTREGTLREACYFGYRYYDVAMLGILQHEFRMLADKNKREKFHII